MLGRLRNRVPVSESDGSLFRLMPIFAPYGILDVCLCFFHSSCPICPRINVHTMERKGKRKADLHFAVAN